MTEIEFDGVLDNPPGFAIRRPALQEIYWDKDNQSSGLFEMWPNSINFRHTDGKKFPTDPDPDHHNERLYELQIPKTLTDFYQKALQRCKQGLGPADGVDGGCTEAQEGLCLIWLF
jgi:hypothetical protein